MKIMLHGATSGSNFGDILFSDLFFEEIKKINPDGDNLFFEMGVFGASDFLKKELKIKRRMSLTDIFSSDALVLISGGYFGERNSTFKENTIRFLRYFPLGLLFILRRKPIFISGVGGGPLSNTILRNSMKYLMDKSQLVTVRDKETKKYFKEYGVEKDIIETSDSAQIVTSKMVPELENDVKIEINKHFKDKKIILLHIYGKRSIDNLIFEKVIPGLNTFLEENLDFGVIVTTDFEFDLKEYNIKKMLSRDTSLYFYNYHDVWQMCALLSNVDVIITPKLHVGILGSTFSKSVISIPMHTEKTARYYKQIDESERCVSLNDISSNQIFSMLEKFKDKKIQLTPDILEKANKNFELLEKSISDFL